MTEATQTLAIFVPVAVLALWTLTVLALIPLVRFRAAAARQVTADDFKYGESSRVPAAVSVPNRVFMNLLEVPVLFYTACVVAFVAHLQDHTLLGLAWAFVGLRVLHSLIYLSYNQVFHRLTVFALATFVVVAMWVILLMRLLAH